MHSTMPEQHAERIARGETDWRTEIRSAAIGLLTTAFGGVLLLLLPPIPWFGHQIELTWVQALGLFFLGLAAVSGRFSQLATREFMRRRRA